MFDFEMERDNVFWSGRTLRVLGPSPQYEN